MRRFFRTAFLLLDAVLIGLFLLGYVSAYLPFGVLWWLELIAIGLPYLAFALLATALVAALVAAPAGGAGRWWLLPGLHVVLVLLFVARLSPLARLSGGAPPGEADLSVLTFSLPVGEIEPRGHKRAARLSATAPLHAFVERLDADVLCFQEANVAFYPERPQVRTQPAIHMLLDTLGYRTERPAEEGAVYTPQPILSRLPVENVSFDWFRYRPEETVEMVVTRAELVWQGRRFALYNLHLRSFGARKPWRDRDRSLLDPGYWRAYLRQYREAFRIREWEAGQVRARIDRETLPVVVVGDFNSTPFSRVYRHLARGLQDVFGAAGRGWGMTYHRRLPFARIDFVLAGPEWKPVSAHTAVNALSDHRAVAARLRWR